LRPTGIQLSFVLIRFNGAISCSIRLRTVWKSFFKLSLGKGLYVFFMALFHSEIPVTPEFLTVTHYQKFKKTKELRNETHFSGKKESCIARIRR
jgi:hypothetical protein